MTNVNLLHDITQKNSGAQRPKSLFKRWLGFGTKPKKNVPSPPPTTPHKPMPKAVTKGAQPSRLRALLLLVLPLVGCILLQGMLEDWLDESAQKMAQRLEMEAAQFEMTYKTPPSVDSWQKRLRVLSNTNQVLEQASSLDIQMSLEYIRQMTDSLPQEAWVKRVTITRNIPNNTHQVEIEGYAFTSETVLLFLAQLKEKPLFDKVELKFSEPTTENGIQEHRFRMTSINTAIDIQAWDVSQSSWLYNSDIYRSLLQSRPAWRTP